MHIIHMRCIHDGHLDIFVIVSFGRPIVSSKALSYKSCAKFNFCGVTLKKTSVNDINHAIVNIYVVNINRVSLRTTASDN